MTTIMPHNPLRAVADVGEILATDQSVAELLAGSESLVELLADADYSALAGPTARAVTLVAEIQPHPYGEAVDIARTGQRLGIPVADFARLVDIAQAADPVAELIAWLDEERRPRMRRALSAAVVAIADEEVQR